MNQKPIGEEHFAGDQKYGSSIFDAHAKKFIDKAVDMIPKPIETYHLTLSTIVWCCFIIIFGYMSVGDIRWLWGSSLMIIFHYLADTLDGAVGRKRKTGLIKWGYYMDHFLDYIFLCSILIGYAFLIKSEIYIVVILAIQMGYLISAYLAFTTTNKFRIDFMKIGPTEVRVLFIIINTLLIFFYDKIRFDIALPIISIISLLGLIWMIYDTQKNIWIEDMERKFGK